MKHKKAPDGGWGWMVVLGIFIYVTFSVGTHKALGVFVPEFADGLDLSIGAVGTSCGIAVGLKGLLGPVWAACALLANTRTILILGGSLTGLGFIVAGFSTNQIHLIFSMLVSSIGLGLPVVAVIKILNDYFDTKYGVATGIAFSGGAIGVIIFPPVMEIVIETYGWRNALFLLGATCFNISACGVLCRPIRSSTRSHCQSCSNGIVTLYKNNCYCRKISGGKVYTAILSYAGITFLLRNKLYFPVFISFVFWGIAYCGWLLFLVSYAIDIGFSPSDASFLSAVGGIGAFVGRIAWTPLTDLKFLSAQTLFIILACIAAVSLFLYPSCSSYWSLALVSFLAGISIGSPPPVMILILKELTSESKGEDFTGAIGLHYMCIGIGTFAGGPIAGYIFDAAGSYNWAFYSMAGAELLAAISVGILNLLNKYVIVRHD